MANPKKSVQSIRKKLNTSIENVRSGDKKKLNTLKLQLDKLNVQDWWCDGSLFQVKE